MSSKRLAHQIIARSSAVKVFEFNDQKYGDEITLITTPGRISRVSAASIAGWYHLFVNPSNFSSSGIRVKHGFTFDPPVGGRSFPGVFPEVDFL